MTITVKAFFHNTRESGSWQTLCETEDRGKALRTIAANFHSCDSMHIDGDEPRITYEEIEAYL